MFINKVIGIIIAGIEKISRRDMSNVTQILTAIEQGDTKAADNLLPLSGSIVFEPF